MKKNYIAPVARIIASMPETIIALSLDKGKGYNGGIIQAKGENGNLSQGGSFDW